MKDVSNLSAESFLISMTFSPSLSWYENTHIQGSIFSHLPLSGFSNHSTYFFTEMTILSFAVILVISKIIKLRNYSNKDHCINKTGASVGKNRTLLQGESVERPAARSASLGIPTLLQSRRN